MVSPDFLASSAAASASAASLPKLDQLLRRFAEDAALLAMGGGRLLLICARGATGSLTSDDVVFGSGLF